MTRGVSKGKTKQTDEERKTSAKERAQSPKYKAKEKERQQRPEVKANTKERKQRSENKARAKEIRDRPENKAKEKERQQRPEVKANARRNRNKPEIKRKINERNQRPELKAKNKKRIDENRLNVLLEYSKRLSNSNVTCCACCGLKDHIDFFALDHIAGRKEMDSEPELVKLGYSSKKRSNSLIKWIIDNNFPNGFQILCQSCNFAKGMPKNNNKCPHEKT